MKLHSHFLIASAFPLMGTLISCQKETQEVTPAELPTAPVQRREPAEPGFAENEMVMYWNDKVATVLGVHTNPGADSRSFAIIEIAVHDALNNIKSKYQCYALHNEIEQHADPRAAVASAAYHAIKGLNAQKTFPVDAWYTESLATISDGQAKELGITLGKKAADAILANRANDGLSQVTPVSPFPPDGEDPGEYRSTLPVSNPDLNLPHVRNIPNWGIVMKPFVVQSNHQFRAPGPYAVNSPEYTIDFNEVKSKGAMVGSTRTAEEEQLMRFWLDNRHHIVWNNFARHILATKKIDAWKTARLFAIIHTAMADGASSMFDSKYHFYYWRPETAIRIADDGNPNTVTDQAWLPSGLLRAQANPLMNFYTPGVPEYPSAFGILGRITGTILQSFFGSDRISIDITSSTLADVSLQYTSISKAVSDNSISKIYAGWYFRKASIDGEMQGTQIANYVINHHFREINED